MVSNHDIIEVLPDTRHWACFYIHPNFNKPFLRIEFHDLHRRSTEVMFNNEIDPQRMIDALEELKMQASTVWICPNCGERIENAEGAELIPCTKIIGKHSKDAETKFCTHCKVDKPFSQMWCEACGTRLLPNYVPVSKKEHTDEEVMDVLHDIEGVL